MMDLTVQFSARAGKIATQCKSEVNLLSGGPILTEDTANVKGQ